jgi:putative FmdB family regulatory protein
MNGPSRPMPLYAYRCPSCDHREEHLQRLADAPIERCASCGEPTRRMVSAAAFHLKGGGWYADGYASAKGDKAEGRGDAAGGSASEGAGGGASSAGSTSSAGSSSGGGGGGTKTDAAKPASTSSGGGGTSAGGGTSP